LFRNKHTLRSNAKCGLRHVASVFVAGKLVRAGDADCDIPLHIRLFRPRSRLSRAAERLRDAVAS